MRTRHEPAPRARAALLLTCCCTLGCGRQAPTTLEALLDAHVQTQPRYPRTLRLVHEVEGQGRRARIVTSMRSHPFAYREDTTGIDPPGTPIVKVSDGRLAWQPRADLPGVPLEGDQARLFLQRAFVEGRRYLDPATETAHFAGPVTLPAGDASPAGCPVATDVFVVDQPIAAAITIRLLFDARDHRLLGTAEPHLERQAWTRYGDWQTYGSLLLPRTRVNGWTNPDRRVTATLIDVEVDPRLDDALFAGHPYATTPARTDGGALVVVADCVPGTAWLFAEECTINGRRAGPALLDTGASSSALAPALADTLALPLGGAHVTGTFTDKLKGYKRWIDHLQIGHRVAHQVTALTGDFAPPTALPPARSPRVIVGGEELLADGPVFDLEHSRLRFRIRPVRPLRSLDAATDVIEIQARRARRGSPCLYVTIRVNGRELLALFDSGFGGTLFLTAKGADKAGVARDPGAQTDPRAFGQDGVGIGPGTRLDIATPLAGFDLGPLRFREVWVHVQSAEGAGDGDRSYEALVGAGIMLPFPRVGIDGDHGVIEFELPAGWRRRPDGSVAVPAAGDFCGAVFTANEADQPAVTTVVQPGSPADRAGLRAGDRLVSIGSDPVPAADLPSLLRRLWLQPGLPVAIHVITGAGEPRDLLLQR